MMNRGYNTNLRDDCEASLACGSVILLRSDGYLVTSGTMIQRKGAYGS